MFPFWLILGAITFLVGLFYRQALRLLGIRRMSEVMITRTLKRSTGTIEQISRWLVVTLGMSFLVVGLGETLPGEISDNIAIALLGLSALMLLAIIGITIANWRGG